VRKQSVEAIVKALNDSGARYLIVGGLAVVAHGYMRFTADVDLILDLEEANLQRSLGALKQLGYRPRAPVTLELFADPQARREWVRDKDLAVFSLYSPLHQETEIDLFVEAPLHFEDAYRSSWQSELAPGVAGTIIGFDDLITLKSKAGRPQDLADLDQLRKLKEHQSHGPETTNLA